MCVCVCVRGQECVCVCVCYNYTGKVTKSLVHASIKRDIKLTSYPFWFSLCFFICSLHLVV